MQPKHKRDSRFMSNFVSIFGERFNLVMTYNIIKQASYSDLVYIQIHGPGNFDNPRH